MTSLSSHANEALNHIAWSKTPKVRNYSHSESFDFRVSAAVSQFNDGISYLTDINEHCKLSPKKDTEKKNNINYCSGQDKKKTNNLQTKKRS
jgi:hypothetical protein